MADSEHDVERLVASDYRGLTLPRGVFYWSGRAKKEAEINATIGTAMARESDFLKSTSNKPITCYLPTLHKIMASLPPDSTYPYAPIAGLPRFRKNWRKWVLHKAGKRRALPEELVAEPVVVPGVTAGLALLGRLFLSPGGRVVCADCRWENYDLLFNGVQGLEIFSHALFDGERFDAEGFRDALLGAADAEGKVVAVMNFPNNPTGYMPGDGETKRLVEAVLEAADAGRRVILIFDDAYDGFVYDPTVGRYSIFPEFVNLHPNVHPFKVDGVSKEFLFYGGRVGCVTAGLHEAWGDPGEWAAAIEDKLSSLIRGGLSNCSRPVQEAAARALDDAKALDREREAVRSILADRWEKLRGAFRELPDFYAVTPFNSGFFCMVDFEGVDAPVMSDHLLKEYKIGTVAWQMPELGVNGVRVAFCGVMAEDIPRLVDGLKKAAETVKARG